MHVYNRNRGLRRRGKAKIHLYTGIWIVGIFTSSRLYRYFLSDCLLLLLRWALLFGRNLLLGAPVCLKVGPTRTATYKGWQVTAGALVLEGSGS